MLSPDRLVGGTLGILAAAGLAVNALSSHSVPLEKDFNVAPEASKNNSESKILIGDIDLLIHLPEGLNNPSRGTGNITFPTLLKYTEATYINQTEVAGFDPLPNNPQTCRDFLRASFHARVCFRYGLSNDEIQLDLGPNTQHPDISRRFFQLNSVLFINSLKFRWERWKLSRTVVVEDYRHRKTSLHAAN